MTIKTRLVPFDADKYTPGKKVITRGGSEVLEVIISNLDISDPVIAYVKDEDEDEEGHRCFGRDGRYLRPGDIDTSYDLHFEEEIEEEIFYLAVRRWGPEGPFRHFTAHSTAEEAKESGQFSPYFMGVLKVAFADEDLIK